MLRCIHWTLQKSDTSWTLSLQYKPSPVYSKLLAELSIVLLVMVTMINFFYYYYYYYYLFTNNKNTLKNVLGLFFKCDIISLTDWNPHSQYWKFAFEVRCVIIPKPAQKNGLKFCICKIVGSIRKCVHISITTCSGDHQITTDGWDHSFYQFFYHPNKSLKLAVWEYCGFFRDPQGTVNYVGVCYYQEMSTRSVLKRGHPRGPECDCRCVICMGNTNRCDRQAAQSLYMFGFGDLVSD